MTDLEGHGPVHDAVIRYITETFPGVDVVVAMGATFFSLDPEKHWPNFATIVTTDEHDMGSPSNLSARPDVYRLNLGVDGVTFQRLVGSATEPDYAALDTFVPHPVYAAQHWVSILDPSWSTWNETVIPLIGLAHDRLAAQRARHGLG
jgi:hypothetical protein